jgi:hypothetical protein
MEFDFFNNLSILTNINIFFSFFFQLNLLEIVLFQTSVGGIQIRYVVSTRVFLAIFVFSQNDDHAWEDIKTKQNGNHP